MSATQSDFIVEQVKLKEKVFDFLIAKDLLKSVEQNCVYFCQKLSANKLAQRFSFDPFVANFNLKFGEIDDG